MAHGARVAHAPLQGRGAPTFKVRLSVAVSLAALLLQLAPPRFSLPSWFHVGGEGSTCGFECYPFASQVRLPQVSLVQ